MLDRVPPAGRAERRQTFRAKGDRELPRRSVQRFGGRVFGRSHQAFHSALPVAVRAGGGSALPPPFRVVIRVVEHLERSGFVVMKKPPIGGGRRDWPRA